LLPLKENPMGCFRFTRWRTPGYAHLRNPFFKRWFSFLLLFFIWTLQHLCFLSSGYYKTIPRKRRIQWMDEWNHCIFYNRQQTTDDQPKSKSFYQDERLLI